MAGEETDIETEVSEEESRSRKSKLSIIGGLLVGGLLAVLAIGGYFATPYIMNMLSPPSGTDGRVLSEIDRNKPALYASLHPPLVVNFRDSYGDSHFMQFTLEVMARDQGIIDQIKNHTAVIRNSLILIYGNVDYDFVTKREGKEKMLADALAEIQEIIERETGDTGVEAVFFTGLIIQ